MRIENEWIKKGWKWLVYAYFKMSITNEIVINVKLIFM